MSQPGLNANISRRQGKRQKQGGIRDGRVRKSKSQEPLGNRPSSLSQTGGMHSQPTQSAPGPQPITMQLPVAQAPDDEPKWEDAGEDRMDSQDSEYDDDAWSKASTEKNPEDAEDDLLGHYGAQRSIETEY